MSEPIFINLMTQSQLWAITSTTVIGDVTVGPKASWVKPVNSGLAETGDVSQEQTCLRGQRCFWRFWTYLVSRWDGGRGRTLILRLVQPVPPSQFFPLGLHLVPELRVWLKHSNTHSVSPKTLDRTFPRMQCFSRLVNNLSVTVWSGFSFSFNNVKSLIFTVKETLILTNQHFYNFHKKMRQQLHPVMKKKVLLK